MKFLEPAWLGALWIVPAAAALYLLARWMRARAVRQFLGESLAALSVRVDWKRRLVKAGLVVAALALVALALARPGFNPEPRKVKRTGRDVAFLIDVSRSMLAEDIKPNRLERAKLAVRDALEAVRGDRVGIIAFAGSSSVRCPLTTDYSFARLTLDALTPESVPVGGTLIGDAIRTALDQLFKTEKGDEGSDRFRDIILITDGEDHESYPVEAAALAGKRGVRIIAIGIGSELGGAPIPAGEKADEEFVKYKGEVVKSREDPESLRKIAAASRDGVFLDVGVGNIQLNKVYRTLMERAEKREIESAERTRYHEGFQVFLGAALLMLVVEGLIGEAPRRRMEEERTEVSAVDAFAPDHDHEHEREVERAA